MAEPVPIRVAEDRTLTIPDGSIVRTAYVPVGRIDLACRDRMAMGDVEVAYRRRLQLGAAQPWPPPVGRWRDHPRGGSELARFEITDGRHDYVAALMLGIERVLVAWIEEEN